MFQIRSDTQGNWFYYWCKIWNISFFFFVARDEQIKELKQFSTDFKVSRIFHYIQLLDL